MNQIKPELVLPIVHLNGTSKETLVELRCDFFMALDAARKALNQRAPNGRDYYPEPGRMDRAIEQHKRRGSLIMNLMKEIEEETDQISRS